MLAGVFTGDLVIKPKVSIGFGSPSLPTMIELQVLEEATGNFGVATYQPPHSGTTTIEIIEKVAWLTSKTQSITPASEIGWAALQQSVSFSAATTVEPSFLRVLREFSYSMVLKTL